MRILVTGGAGFLGSFIVDKLIDDKHNVVVIDDLSTGRIENISNHLENPNFTFFQHDVIIEKHLDVEGIFNLACPASPIAYQKNPVKTLQTNVYGAINTLNLALRCQARILQASTSEIYGDPLMSPQKEEYWGNVNPIGIRSCYDEGKRAAETLFFDYHRLYRLDVKLARIFNTYGPRMAIDDGRVVTNFVFQALRGKDLTVFGDGSQTRSFCFVDDLVEGLLALFFSDGCNNPINLGNPEPTTMLQLANEIIEMTNSNSKIVFEELPMDDPKIRNPDISLAQEKLNWSPKISRRTGLERTINYIASQIDLTS
jgi:UDP-glucuronate decarboxylase